MMLIGKGILEFLINDVHRLKYTHLKRNQQLLVITKNQTWLLKTIVIYSQL